MKQFSDIDKGQERTNPAPDRSDVKNGQGIDSSFDDLIPLELESRKRAEPDKSPRYNPGNEIIACHEKLISKAMDVRERIEGDQGIITSPILSDLYYIIDKDLIDELYEYAMFTNIKGEYYIIHSVDVAVASLKIGIGLKYDLKMLLKLGLAAFLENIGMYKLPDSLLKRSDRLGDQEKTLIKRHPEISHDILSRMGEKYEWLAETALQVHERSDGSGYPRGLKGDEILEMSYIIGIVDSFMAMIKNRPYREKFIGTEAVREIVGTGKVLFPPRILKTFLNQITLFPVNSFIRLNNGSIGRVKAVNKSEPLRPIIEIIYDGSGNRLKKTRVVRLSENPLLHIEGGVDIESIANDFNK